MEIIQEIQDDIKIFRLSGRLDHTTSQEIEDELSRAISGGSNKIIVNLENLEYMSSAGIRLFFEAYHTLLRKDGQLILCSMKKHIREIYKKTGIEDVVQILDNMDQALKAF
jgi:anti-sigma B factor antagonist